MTTRRELFTASAAVAAGAALLQEVRGAENPAQNVEDRGAKIKITSLRGFRFLAKAFIKIETSAGITGWGEVTGLEPTVAIALAESLFELLDGQNPTRVEYLWNRIYRSHRDMRGGPFMTHVLSAIDMALWDITGKAWGVPVYRLLGGPMRDKIRMYPTEKAHKCAAGGPRPHAASPQEVMGLVNTVRETRKRVGADGVVMFDCHCMMPPPMVLQFAAALEPSELLFLEEAATPNSIEVFKRLKQHVKIPMAAGERDRTIWGMLPYLQERALDILQPDVGQTGGITQVKKIATIAEAYSVPLAPHNTCTEIGLTASLHCSASIAEFLIQEGYPKNYPPGATHRTWTIDAEGYASLPQENGLGVDVDEAAFDKINAEAKGKFKWPTPSMPDGSITDY
jgi:galactonate dehydratase